MPKHSRRRHAKKGDVMMSNIPSHPAPYLRFSHYTWQGTDYASDSARGLSISTANWRFHVMHMKPSILQSFMLRLLSRDWATATWLLSLVESSICLSYAVLTPKSKETKREIVMVKQVRASSRIGSLTLHFGSRNGRTEEEEEEEVQRSSV